MSRKKKSGPLFVVLGLALALVGTAAMVVNGPLRTVPRELAKESGHQPSKPPKSDKVTNYSPSMDEKGELKLKGTETDVPSGSQDSVVVDAVNTYLGKVPAVPKAAKLQKVEMDGTTANLTFNKEFQAGYGTDDEQTIINGVLVTLSQFPEIKKAQFLIEGKPMESLGNIDLSTPQDVIKPEDLHSPAPDQGSPANDPASTP